MATARELESGCEPEIDVAETEDGRATSASRVRVRVRRRGSSKECERERQFTLEIQGHLPFCFDLRTTAGM